MRVRPHKQKRLHTGGVGPRLLTLAGQEPTPQKETPLPGRRASDAIAGGVSAEDGSTFEPNGKWLEPSR